MAKKKKAPKPTKPAYRSPVVKFSAREYAALRGGLDWVATVSGRGARKTLAEWDAFVAEVKGRKA